MITVYGIKTCDTCRKALAWLRDTGIDHRFHDLRADGLGADQLDRWVKAVGWEALLNRRSTTWRGLNEADRADLTVAKAAKLMVANPTLVKRPVFEDGTDVLVGFSGATRDALA